MTEAKPAIDPIPHADDVPRRVLRWLAIAGVVFGGYQVLSLVLLLLARWGLSSDAFARNPFIPSSLAGTARQLYRLMLVLSLSAPILLTAGSIGLLRGRRWARPLLLTYACLQVAASAAAQLLTLPQTLSPAMQWTPLQRVFVLYSSVGALLSTSLFPAAIFACLYKPGLERYGRSPSHTFPVLPAAPPGGEVATR